MTKSPEANCRFPAKWDSWNSGFDWAEHLKSYHPEGLAAIENTLPQRRAPRDCKKPSWNLVKPGEFGFDVFEERNSWIGIFPEFQEFLIVDLCFQG